MRPTALLAVLLTLPTIAFAQDPAKPAAKRPTGTALLDALPAQFDVVVDAPDVQALFDAYVAAGIGDAASWKSAFDAQLKAWGDPSDAADKLVRGGDALLAAADGEALVASLSLRLPDAPAKRAWLFAMTTTADEKALRAAFTDVADGGLKRVYEGASRVENIGGRRVVVLYGNRGNLFVHLANGFAAASDDPLALGLLFQGLGKTPAAAPESRPGGSSLKLVVRRGHGDAAWEGGTWGEGESVTWKADKPMPARIPVSSEFPGYPVLQVCADRVGDVEPLIPVTPHPGFLEHECDTVTIGTGINYDGTKSSIWGWMQKGGYSDPMWARFPKAVAGAGRLQWLVAFGAATLPTPFPAIDASLVHGPLESAMKRPAGKLGEFVEWKSTAPGRLAGPIGHGPATFLALRCLYDVGHGTGPNFVPPPLEPPPPSAPLPPPTEPRNK